MNIPDTTGDLCTRSVTIADPAMAVDDAAQLMRSHHVGCLVVVEEGPRGRRPIGMLTDRDIVTAIIARGVAPRALQVGDVMSGELITAKDSDSVSDALFQMRRRGVRRLPVVGADGMLVGLVTLDDMLEYVAGQLQTIVAAIGREQRQELQSRP